MNVEKVHRYPRYFTITVEILSAITVVLALALLGRDLLRLLWSIYDLDTALFARLPWLTDLVLIISDANTPPPAGLMDLRPRWRGWRWRWRLRCSCEIACPPCAPAPAAYWWRSSTTGCRCRGKIFARSR